MSNIIKKHAESWSNYELIDAGGGKKLERFGEIIIIRPELQAYFKSEIPFTTWYEKAHFEFVEDNHTKGKWKKLLGDFDNNWHLNIDELTINLELTKFKHIGIFPEQYSNWKLISENLNSGDNFLNLFAYTGVASLFARRKEANVTHVDSLKQLLNWSKENMGLSQLSDIRWVLEDALKFAQKEVKREKKYKGIIMDPPAFGLGTKGEKWILEQKLPELLKTTNDLMEDDSFLIMNTYSPKLLGETILTEAKKQFYGKKVHIEELWMKTSTGKDLFFGNTLKVNCI
jgi:23S rRNA (cytosine1962-C5)-methyltransferase